MKILACLKALSDKQRIRIVLALSGGELCLCSLQEILELSPSTVSRHVAILKKAGLVVSRTKGKWRYFSLAPGIEYSPEGALIRWVIENLENDPEAEEKRTVMELREGQEARCSSRVVNKSKERKQPKGD